MEYFYNRLIKHYPRFLKKIYSSISTPRYNTNFYERWQISSLYHSQNLTNFEVRIGIRTLHKIEQLITNRKKIIKNIYNIIIDKNNLHLKPLFPYREDYIYFRIPALVEDDSLHKWKNLFYKQGEIIDMIYRPISNNILIHEKCILLKNYSISENVYMNLLLLPINNNVKKFLEKFDII